MPDAAEPSPSRDDLGLLQHAVEEAARLLDADGAMVYLVDERRELLRFAVDAGVRNAEARQLIRDLTLPIGTGLFGTAAARGEVVVTGDYRRDRSFRHSPVADRIVAIANMRSFAVAPLIAEGEVLGGLGSFTSRIDDFDDAKLGLLRALADHAAAAIWNRRLIERLDRSQAELAHRVEAQRTLAGMAAQLSTIRDPSTALKQTLEDAVRLLNGDGGQIGLVTPDEEGAMRWGDGHSLVRGKLTPFTKEDRTPVTEGVSGRVVQQRQTSWTYDYVADDSFAHAPASDQIARDLNIRAVIAAPLIGEDGPIGAIGVYAERPGAFDADDGELITLLADQAAGILTNSRLYRETQTFAEQLERRVEAQRALAEIAAEITSLRDPSAILRRTVAEAKRLLGAEHVVIHQVRAGTRELADYSEHFGAGTDTPPVDEITVSIGQGVAGRAVSERRVVWTGDYLADDSFAHTPKADAWITRYGYRSQMAAPLIGESGALGDISAYSSRPDAFDTNDAELLGTLAAQAAIVLSNASLYALLQRRLEAQRTLGAIAAQITALREPGDVLQRTLDEAVRLLDADGGRIELVERGGLHWAFGHSAIDLPIERDEEVDPVELNEGVSGRAVIERRVVRTGDYLADTSFHHAEAPDRYIREHGIRSVMAAPLIGENGAIGSLTVHSQARDAFDDEGVELLEILAAHAAVAVTNARINDQLAESEARYRFLVDNSPDMIWATDVDGRFTFVSDSIESLTGHRAEEALGRHWSALTVPEFIGEVETHWAAMRADPTTGHRLRIEIPHRDGGRVPVEISTTPTVTDGRFSGAHGSVRDISERERLEGDLRAQAAELAANQERAHLARELHDSVTQALFSMGLTMRSLELLMVSDPEAARAKLTELRELQKDALAEMRTLIFELRPASLETDGLTQAIRTHAAAVQGRTGLNVTVDAEPMDRLPLPVEEALYRIGQEALHNVVKHANAGRAAIRLERESDRVRLTVEDDGVGFDIDAVPRGHIGLLGMRQRADLMGGELTLRTQAGRGTHLEVTVPATVREPVSAE
ncbi:MAG: GAF domain-containing protein [Candidatus Limnocylindria bacterium]